MSYLSRFAHAVSAGSLVLVALEPSAAAAQTAERLRNATAALEALVKTPDDAIPQHILDRAEAIVVIPTLVKGGFIVGAEHGRGVMSVRDRASGAWSPPAFVAMTGGSVGWQIGVQSTDLVLLVMNRDGVDDLLRTEFKLGADASVAAGPVGRSAQAGTDATMTAKILAYSRARGLFAGLTVQGSTVREDRDANEEFYGRSLDTQAVFGLPVQPALPSDASTWRAALTRIAPFSR